MKSRSTPLLVVLVLAIVLAVLWWRREPTKPATAQTPASAPTATQPSSAASVPAATNAAPAPSPVVATVDPAVQAALQQANPVGALRAFGEAFAAWVARDFEAALAFVRRMPAGTSLHGQAVQLLLAHVLAQDPMRALTLANELATTRETRSFYNALFERWAREDLATATTRLALVPAGEARENAIRALADTWARRDSAAALAWARALPDAAERSPAIEAALHELSLQDPRRAIDLAQESLSGPALERTLARAVESLARTNPSAAAEALSRFSSAEYQATAALAVAQEWAARDVASAMAWAQSLPLPAGTLAFNRVLTSWGQRDPAAAARFVAALPADRLTGAVGPFSTLYASADLEGAKSWAATLPDERARHLAEIMIASTWAQRDPAAACTWAATFEGSTRETALAGAFSYWRLRDAPAAEAWLQATPLPAELRTRLQRRDGVR